jgi:hypothetical protein
MLDSKVRSETDNILSSNAGITGSIFYRYKLGGHAQKQD